ncbi:MAG TPA: SDR family NAD(P)-dependent oxidoreductase [Anaerolineae bacterium]|nr:SDR family NAD(P)-dependent oxidoreductase [Anaerolineae bacterium]
MVTQVTRAALIIGASSGVGAALARRLAREGYALGLAARRIDRLQALCDELTNSYYIRAFAYQHDVGNATEVPALLDRITNDLGDLDLFIYCAGVLFPNDPAGYHVEQDQLILQVNLIGAAAWIDPIAQYFQQKHRGHIVGIGSIAGDRGRRGMPAYTASKAGLHTYLEGMRNRLWRDGAIVTTIKLGQVETDMLKNADRKRRPISADRAAELIWHAIEKRQQTVYVPSWWRGIGLAVQHMPSFIFRRLNI